MLSVPHKAQKGEALLLLRVDPCPPIILKVISGVFQCRWSNRLAVASPNEIYEQAMEEVRHVVLLLSSSALAEALDQQDGLQYPEVRLSREAAASEDLWAKYIMNAHLSSVI
jgi:hypothetical protein